MTGAALRNGVGWLRATSSATGGWSANRRCAST